MMIKVGAGIIERKSTGARFWVVSQSIYTSATIWKNLHNMFQGICVLDQQGSLLIQRKKSRVHMQALQIAITSALERNFTPCVVLSKD